MIRHSVAWAALLLAVGGPVRAQQSGQGMGESHKYRTIATIAGGGGGFTLGVFAGIGAFDDSTYASGKIWTTALICAAGGAVGGYLLGRSLDRRSGSSVPVRTPDALDWSLLLARPCHPGGPLPCLPTATGLSLRPSVPLPAHAAER